MAGFGQVPANEAWTCAARSNPGLSELLLDAYRDRGERASRGSANSKRADPASRGSMQHNRSEDLTGQRKLIRQEEGCMTLGGKVDRAGSNIRTCIVENGDRD